MENRKMNHKPLTKNNQPSKTRCAILRGGIFQQKIPTEKNKQKPTNFYLIKALFF